MLGRFGRSWALTWWTRKRRAGRRNFGGAGKCRARVPIRVHAQHERASTLATLDRPRILKRADPATTTLQTRPLPPPEGSACRDRGRSQHGPPLPVRTGTLDGSTPAGQTAGRCVGAMAASRDEVGLIGQVYTPPAICRSTAAGEDRGRMLERPEVEEIETLITRLTDGTRRHVPAVPLDVRR
jgi:hypothetical protein